MIPEPCRLKISINRHSYFVNGHIRDLKVLSNELKKLNITHSCWRVGTNDAPVFWYRRDPQLMVVILP